VKWEEKLASRGKHFRLSALLPPLPPDFKLGSPGGPTVGGDLSSLLWLLGRALYYYHPTFRRREYEGSLFLSNISLTFSTLFYL
jgi:hypothetical protein